MQNLISFNFVHLLASIALSLGYALQYGVKGRLLWPAVLGSTISWLILGFIEAYVGSTIIASFLAAVFVSVWAIVFSRVKKAPSTIFQIIGVLPLVPGRFIYLTMVELVENRVGEAINLGIETAAISLAITIAILLVTSTSALLTHVIGRYRRKI